MPAINDAGEVAFYASFTTGSGGSGVVRGSGEPGSIRLVVRQGDPAPDGNGNFGLFDASESPSLNSAGQVVFPASFVGTFGPNDTTGVVRGDVVPNRLVLLARQGQTVDGLALGRLVTPPPSVNTPGKALFTSDLIGGLLLNDGDSNAVLARLGQTLLGGTLFAGTGPGAVLNDQGQIALSPFVTGPTIAHVRFLRVDGTTFVEVVRHGDPVPDHDGTFDLVLTSGLIRTPALNELGELAFHAAVGGASPPRTEGIFRGTDPDHLVTIVRRGDTAPGGNGSFLSFDMPAEGSLALDDAGEVAFRATLTGTSQGSADNKGIFRGDGDQLIELVRNGQTAPDGDGTFADFDLPAINALGQVAFRATLAGTANVKGMFLYDDEEGLIQVARQGQALLGTTIAAMAFAPDTSRGRKHLGLNVQGEVAFQFDLQDGRRGVAVWSPGSSPTTTSTTTTVPGGTSSTTSTTLATTTSTTLPAATTSTIAPPSTTTTSLPPPCTTFRCTVDAIRDVGSCADETIPTPVESKIDVAVTRSELAASETGARGRRLRKSAVRLLAVARRVTKKAAGGRRPKLSKTCASELATTLRPAAAFGGASR